RIEYQINLVFSLGAGVIEPYYPIIQRYCDAPLTCIDGPVSLIAGKQEEWSPPASGETNHPVYVKTVGTSVVNVSIGSPGIANAYRVIDSDTDNYATIGAAVVSSTAYSNYGISVVSEQSTPYPAG